MTQEYNKSVKILKDKNLELYNNKEFDISTYNYLNESFFELENPTEISNVNLAIDKDHTNRDISKLYGIYGENAKMSYGKQSLNTSNLKLLRLKDIQQKYLNINNSKLELISENQLLDNNIYQDTTLIKLERINNSNQLYLCFIGNNDKKRDNQNNYLSIGENDSLIVNKKSIMSIWKFVKYNNYYYIQSIGKPNYVINNSVNVVLGKIQTTKWNIEPVLDVEKYNYTKFSVENTPIKNIINSYKCSLKKKQELNNQIQEDIMELELINRIDMDDPKFETKFKNEGFQVAPIDIKINTSDLDKKIKERDNIIKKIKKYGNQIIQIIQIISNLEKQLQNVDCPSYMKIRRFSFSFFLRHRKIYTEKDCEDNKIRQRNNLNKRIKDEKIKQKKTEKIKNDELLKRDIINKEIEEIHSLLEKKRLIKDKIVMKKKELNIERYQDLNESDEIIKKEKEYEETIEELRKIYKKLHETKIQKEKNYLITKIHNLYKSIKNNTKTIEGYANCSKERYSNGINIKMKNLNKDLKETRDDRYNEFTTNYNLNQNVVQKNKSLNKKIQELDNKHLILNRNIYIMKENIKIIKSNNHTLYIKTKGIKFIFNLLVLLVLILILLVIKNIGGKLIKK